jgi:hypothetical protein
LLDEETTYQQASPGYVSVSQNGDAIERLKSINYVAYDYLMQKYIPQALHEKKKRFYNCHELWHQPTQAYFLIFSKSD